MMKSRPIKILFDAVPLSQERPTGVGRTEAGLIEALVRNYPSELTFVGHYFDFLGRKKRRGFEGTLVKAPNIRYRRTVVLPGKVFNMLRRLRVPIPYELFAKERGDFHLFPNFLGWPSLFKTPSAPYIHDATYIETPEYVQGPNLFDLRTIIPSVIKRSSFIITNTGASTDSLKKIYPWYDRPFVVAHIPPVANNVISREESSYHLKKLGIEKQYILFHATLEPRKNLVNLLLAYRSLPAHLRSTYSLVISGGKGWKDEEITEAIQQAKNDGYDIRQVGYVSDNERAALFMDAKLYVLPSFYEGFGMQILEAFFYKTPVLASDIPVLKEVGSDACYYTGTSEKDIERALQTLLKDDKRLNAFVLKGSKRLKDFDWDIIVKDVYAAIVTAVERTH